MKRYISNEEIYRAAEKVYKDTAPRVPSVSDICRAADISRKTFYQRFKNIEDFKISILKYNIGLIITEFKTLRKNTTGFNVLWDLLDVLEEVSQKHPFAKHILTNSFTNNIIKNGALYYNYFRDIENEISNFIKDGIANGSFRAVDAEKISKITVNLLFCINFVLEENNKKEKDVIKEGMKILLHESLKPFAPRLSIE